MPNAMASSLICLVGGGEHARVIADLVAASPGHQVEGYWGPKAMVALTHLGDDALLKSQFRTHWQTRSFHMAVVGKPGSDLRRRLLATYSDLPIQWATLVHPHAVVSSSAHLGEGCFIAAGAVVNTGAQLAAHVIVNTAAIAEHDAKIGVGVHLAPGAIVGGGVEIGDWAVLGLGCRVRDHVRIGKGAVVAMGAVVVEDVEPGSWVKGVPARPFNRSPAP